MDIDISHFSKKALRLLRREIFNNYPLLLLVLAYILIMVAVFVPIVYFTIGNIRAKELTMPLTLLGCFVGLAFCWPIIRWRYDKGLEIFKRKKLANGYFPKCYECNCPGNEAHVCPKCGADLSVKYVEVPVNTLEQFKKQSLLTNIICLLLVFPLSLVTFKLSDAWRDRHTSLKMMTSTEGSFIKLYSKFSLGQKVGYQDSSGKIIAVGINDRFDIVYSLEVGGKKITGVEESMLTKTD